jgi:hypothetical protein
MVYAEAERVNMVERSIKPVGNFETMGGLNVASDVMREFVMTIVYHLSAKSHEKARNYHMDELITSLDLLAFTAEYCKLTPGIKSETVRRWKDETISIFDRVYNFDPVETTSGYFFEHRKCVMAIFERLERVADLYPPPSWMFSED